MKTLSNNDLSTTTKGKDFETFSTTLKDGRVISIREMTGRDLIYMEKELNKCSEFEKAMKLIEHLVVGEEKITYDEIIDLVVKDYRKLNELVERANGLNEEDDSPN